MASSSQSTLPKAATFHVPIEITIEILSRLPVKSLLRFKSVCKTWYALIESPNFISKHLSFTLNSDSHFNSLLVTTANPVENNCFYSYISMSLLYFNIYGFIDVPINLDFPLLNERDSLYVVGVCDGLVCLSLDQCGDDRLILCNPATRQFREIPRCKLELDYGVEIQVLCFFGFGFDPIANDYKLLRIAYCGSPIKEWVVRAHLYAVSTGTWREFDASKLSFFHREVEVDENNKVVVYIFGSPASAVVNGVFYWLAVDGEMVVVRFDLGDEMFRKIRTPWCLDGVWGETKWQIMQMKGEVGLVIFDSRHGRGFDVWVLNENESSWTNQVKVGYFPRIASPVECGENNGGGEITVVGCGRNGCELVVTELEKSGDLKLFLYDPKSQEIRKLRFGRVPYRSSICLYTETLLPVKLNNGIGVQT